MSGRGRLVLSGVAALALVAFLWSRGSRDGPPGSPERRAERVEGEAPVEAVPAPRPDTDVADSPGEPGSAIESPAPVSVARGRVLGSDARPLQDAQVLVEGRKPTWTDEDGAFELPLPPGKARLEVSHHRHLAKDLDVEVPAEGLEIQLDAGYSVSGRVTFPGGLPAPGIQFQQAGAGRWARTDEDGRFVISGLERGPVTVESPEAQLERTAETGDANVDFVLREHLVLVHAVDARGKPVMEGRVKYEVGDGIAGGGGRLDPETGTETFFVPKGARLTYSIESPGKVRKGGEFRPEGEPAIHEITLVLPEPGVPGGLSLRVLDDGGKPLKRVTVTLVDRFGGLIEGYYEVGTNLDGEGRHRLDGLQPGTYRMTLSSAPGPWDTSSFGLTTEKEVQVESEKYPTVEVRLEAGGWLRVTVRDGSGEVIAPGGVRVLDEAGEFVGSAFWGPDKDGKWSWPSRTPGPVVYGEPLPPGSYKVEVLRGGGSRDVVGTAEVLVVPREVVNVEVRLGK